jgi:hypothetical protein
VAQRQYEDIYLRAYEALARRATRSACISSPMFAPAAPITITGDQTSSIPECLTSMMHGHRFTLYAIAK